MSERSDYDFEVELSQGLVRQAKHEHAKFLAAVDRGEAGHDEARTCAFKIEASLTIAREHIDRAAFLAMEMDEEEGPDLYVKAGVLREMLDIFIAEIVSHSYTKQ